MKRTFLLTVLIGFSLGIHAQSIPILNNNYHYYGPNSTWGEYLKVGGNGRETTKASVVTTNGNLHLDSKDGRATYINHYSKGNTLLNTQGGSVGIGTATPSGKLHVKGETYVDGGWLRVLGQKGLYFQNYGGGLYMTDNTWIRTYGNKNFYHNTGIMRTDGAFQVGSDGSRFSVRTDGKVGIGTTNPKAVLDVGKFIPNEALGTVFGRLQEGNTSGDGTYLGVKGYDTQPAKYNGKSFSIVHNFYGNTNNSINFFRGGSVTGGFLTFNTNNNSEKMRINGNGNVGIGTTNPLGKLDIKLGGWGNIPRVLFKQTSDNPSIRLYRPTGSGTGIYAWWIENRGGQGLTFKYGTNSVTTGNESVASKFTIINNGNVGIGTTNPDSKLSVNGKIHAREVKVDLIGWSDFVFEKEYNLPTLKQVENHIKEKGHLQDIPSAKEVAKNGIFLGEMNAKLLQKIEELTLYTIDQEKKLNNQSLMLEKQNEQIKIVSTILLNLQSKLEKVTNKISK
jgi:hypothetical protein